MADFDFLTTGGAAIFTPSRPPVYPVDAGNLKNVVAGETLGGKVRSQTRGTDRRTLHLVFPRMTATDITNFRALHASYGAMKGAFKIAVSASEFPGIGAAINLTTPLEAINLKTGVTLDIEGQGATLNGGGSQRGLFVYSGVVTVENLTLANMKAVGG